MTPGDEHVHYLRLANGIDLAVLPTGRRSVTAIEMRFLGGYAYERPDRLGVAHILAETMTKGTQRRDGRALNDAFDEIGTSYAVSAARETFVISCVCLPEFVAQAVELLAEMINEPSFPGEACEVAVELARQSLAALEDDPLELAKKCLCQQAYSPPLNRHVYGEPATVERIGREDVVEHWRTYLKPDRLLVSVAGAVDPSAVADLFERLFPATGLNDPVVNASLPLSFPLGFRPGQSHRQKDLEQEQIGVCFPGASAVDEDEAVERVIIGLLSGGMSSRLWQSIREKQGLVYWVGAWFDRPRTGGMIHLGSSCTPQNLEATSAMLLKEVNRLADDVTESEVQRAISGILAAAQTHGDVTRAKATRIVNDLFYLGRPIPLEEKLSRIRAVTIGDVRQYLRRHPREQLSIVTVGPRCLKDFR